MRPGDVEVMSANGKMAWATRDEVESGQDLIDTWKVFTSKASTEHAGQASRDGTRVVLGRVGVVGPNVVVTESYILLGTFLREEEANNELSYVTTRFFRFLVSLRAFTQDIVKPRFAFVPMQDFSKPWTDEELYAKYGLTEAEISFIESMIRPMEPSDTNEGK